jgi:hypothetical protein
MSKIPTVFQGMVETDTERIIELNSPQWLDWVRERNCFRYEPTSSHPGFTARAEKSGYWYAYRKVSGKLHKRYIGKPEELTTERLEQIAELLSKSPQPRTSRVTEESSVAPKTSYATNEDIAQLWQAIGELRQSLAAPLKVESPVAQEQETTGQQSIDASTVTESEVINQLHNQVAELQKEVDRLHKRIKNQDEQLRKADELNQEMVELRPQHWLTTEELRIKRCLL